MGNCRCQYEHAYYKHFILHIFTRMFFSVFPSSTYFSTCAVLDEQLQRAVKNGIFQSHFFTAPKLQQEPYGVRAILQIFTDIHDRLVPICLFKSVMSDFHVRFYSVLPGNASIFQHISIIMPSHILRITAPGFKTIFAKQKKRVSKLQKTVSEDSLYFAALTIKLIFKKGVMSIFLIHFLKGIDSY